MRTVLALALICCGSRDRVEPTVVTSPPPPIEPAAPKPSSRIDELFRSYEQKLPEPASLSESNGASVQCERHGYATYTLLAGTARRLPIERDADLIDVVPWARASDPCIRYIAIEAIVRRIGFDTNRVSLPGMHEPEHHHFHEIHVALRAFFEARRVRVPPPLFAEMWLTVTPQDLAFFAGSWHEDLSATKNFQTSVELDAELVRVTSRRTQPDPAWPDHTWTTKIAKVTVDERARLIVAGAWDVESNAKGYQGQKIVPSGFTYAIWPVAADVIWFDEGRNSWTKLRRVAK